MTNGGCGACGALLEPGAVYCAECGSRVSDHARASSPTPPAPAGASGATAAASPAVAMPAASPGELRGRFDGDRAAQTGAVPSPYGSVTAPTPSGERRTVPVPVLPPVEIAPPLAPAPPGPVPPRRGAARGPGRPPASVAPPAPGLAGSAPWGVASDHRPAAPSRGAPSATARPASHRGSLVAVAPGAVAPVGRRVAAFAVDLVGALVVFGAAATAAGGLTGAGAGPHALVVADGAVLLLGLGQWVAEASTGATIGGAALRIRTLSARTGRPAGLWRILLRQLVVALGTLACYVGQWVVVASGAWDSGPAQRGWHDKAAGTIVLRSGARGVAVPSGGAYASAVARVVGQDAPVSASRAPAAVADPPAPEVPVDPATIAPVAPIPVPAFARDVAAGRGGGGTADSAEGLITGPPGFVAPHRSEEPSREPSTVTAAVPALSGRDCVPLPDWSGAAPLESAPVTRSGDAAPASRVASTAAGTSTPAAPALARDDLGDLEHTRLRPVSPAAPWEQSTPTGALRLVFDTGERIDVDGDGLVGRDPGAAADLAHVVAIDDPERSVSKVHLAFGLDGSPDRLWVVDRGSTNGTVLVKPDGAYVVLPAGARASVAAGWSIRFGERTVRVEPR